MDPMMLLQNESSCVLWFLPSPVPLYPGPVREEERKRREEGIEKEIGRGRLREEEGGREKGRAGERNG
jgi:hypothetical protein